MMHKLKKALPWWVMVLVLAVGAMDLRAEDTVIEALKDTKVCTAESFMEAVVGHTPPECKMTREGSTAALMGVLAARPPLYLIIGDGRWWVAQASDWKVRDER